MIELDTSPNIVAGGDIGVNIASFGRHLRVVNNPVLNIANSPPAMNTEIDTFSPSNNNNINSVSVQVWIGPDPIVFRSG